MHVLNEGTCMYLGIILWTYHEINYTVYATPSLIPRPPASITCSTVLQVMEAGAWERGYGTPSTDTHLQSNHPLKDSLTFTWCVGETPLGFVAFSSRR